ncbi:MAG TPA: nucleoside-triphosphatase [Anaerovoracaceae bacterium]|nr:nucleoside-triphosphatase [Anaerovoracaceae bacterium]
MHVFLCGPIKIGKSTVIQKVINELKLETSICLGGFVTHPGLGSDRDIYISPAWEDEEYESKNRVANRGLMLPTSFPEVFNHMGTSILQRKSSRNLICMDELGFLEEKAFDFQNAVLRLLDENIPILGVVKEVHVPWLESVKTHPSVKLINISLDNRNAIVKNIVNILKPSVIKKNIVADTNCQT